MNQVFWKGMWLMSKKVMIIGAGPGGYVAAIHAAKLGCDVTLIEKNHVGGVCLNCGCIPTKALVASAEMLRHTRRIAEYGIDLMGEIHPNLAQIMARKDAVVTRLTNGVSFLLKKNKVNLVKGSGRFLSPTEVEVTTADGDKQEYSADAFIIATGTVPAVPPVFSFDGDMVITSEQALNLRELPKSMIIIGGGVIGCEFASILSELGVKISVIEMLPGLLPMLEPELGKSLAATFTKRGIEVKTGVKVTKVTKTAETAVLSFENGEVLEAEKVLVSIGRRAETDSLNLSAAGVKMDQRGKIQVDSRLCTNIANIYAIGDVNNLRYDLAHAASYQAKVAVDNLCGTERTVDEYIVPSCVFTLPEIASVGMTEQEAKEAGLIAKTAKFPYMANGKALAMGEAEGFVKIIADSASGKVLGVHIMGAHASDLIAEATLAVFLGLTAADLGSTIHAHPTLAETIMEASEMINNQAIHI